MKLRQPFDGYFRISQLFGHPAPTYTKDGLLGHQGIDFACPTGTPILSSTNGTVYYVSTDFVKGEGVSVMSDDIFQYKGEDCKFTCVYWHLKDGSIKVKVGDKVKIGDVLALSNNTGNSTGPHLHFSICPLAADGSRRFLEYNNGYNGNIDPLPYLDLTLPPIAPSGSDKIKELQILLNKYGAKLVIDGKFGKLSNKALQDFLKVG